MKDKFNIRQADKISRKVKVVEPQVRFSRIPTADGCDYKVSTHWVGIVVPMGHGKTTLAEEEGWVDVDSLVGNARMGELRDVVAQEMRDGSSFRQASRVIGTEASTAIKLLSPQRSTIIMAQTPDILDEMGICVLGGVCVDPTVVIEANRHRDAYEKALIRQNISEVLSDQGSTPYGTYDNMDAVADYVYQVCDALDIPVGRPMTGVDGNAPLRNLDEVIEEYDAGWLSRESVDYQVRKHELRTYKGFGFGWNEWAKVACTTRAYINCARVDQDWVAWPLGLESLSKNISLEEHTDVSLLLSVHAGEHERFLTTLILHWKLVGSISELRDILFPLYTIRRIHWRHMFNKIRAAVSASGSLFGVQVSKEDKELIAAMAFLSVGDSADLKLCAQEAGVSFPRASPSEEQVNKILAGFKDVVYEPATYKAVPSNFFSSLGSIDSIVSKDTMLGCITRALATRLLTEWEDQPGCVRQVKTVIKSIARGPLGFKNLMRDEWSDTTETLLNTQGSFEAVSWAVTEVLSCEYEMSIRGEGWYHRIHKAMQGFMVCSHLKADGQKIMVQRSGGIVQPFILDFDENALWVKLVSSNIPRTALGAFSIGPNHLQAINEYVMWSDSKGMMIMEMVNLKSWYPDASKRMILTSVCRWADRFTSKRERTVLDKILNEYTRRTIGRSFTSVEDRLLQLCKLDGKDGGLACYERVYGGKAEMKDGIWSGHGGIKLDDRPKKSKSQSLSELVGKFRSDESAGQARITTRAVYSGGIAIILLLRSIGKTEITSHCTLLRRLKEQQ